MMEKIPPKLEQAFVRDMQRLGLDRRRWQDWLKWLRFYLDYCKKYDHPPRERSSLDLFIAKLASKRQSVQRQADARECLGQFYQTVAQFPPPGTGSVKVLPSASTGSQSHRSAFPSNGNSLSTRLGAHLRFSADTKSDNVLTGDSFLSQVCPEGTSAFSMGF